MSLKDNASFDDSGAVFIGYYLTCFPFDFSLLIFIVGIVSNDCKELYQMIVSDLKY